MRCYKKDFHSVTITIYCVSGILVFLAGIGIVWSVSYPDSEDNAHFYPYGDSVGDSVDDSSDDGSSGEESMDVSIGFFGGSYDSIWVCY